MIKKNENSNFLLEIIRYDILNTTNEFKNHTLYLADENITSVDLGEIISKPVGEIIAFF